MNIKITHDEKSNFDIHCMDKVNSQFNHGYGLSIVHCYRANKSTGKELRLRHFEFYSLSHMYAGKGIYHTETGKPIEINQGQGVLVGPNFVHTYGTREEYYLEDSICFTGPIADALFNVGIIQNGVLEIGGPRRLLPIIEQVSDPSLDAQLGAHIALQQLLLDIYRENRLFRARKQNVGIQELLRLIRATPEKWWTINEMAEFCNLSTAQFRRVFFDCTGILPKLYVDRLKITMASNALISSDDQLEQIAQRLGYKESFHLSRRFKQITGLSPQNYRKKFYGQHL